MSSALSTPSGSRPQRAAAGRSAGKVTNYAEDDAGGEDESGDDDDDDDGEADDDQPAVGEDDDFIRLQGAVARHRQVAALAAGVPYTPEKRKGLHKPRAASNQKRISQARIDAIENVIVPEAGDIGWMAEPASLQEAPHIFNYIISAIKSHIVAGRRIAESLEHLPNESIFFQVSDHPIALSAIEANVASGQYQSSRAFEFDMLEMFTTFRRGYGIGHERYADTVILQRLYQRITRCQTNQKYISVQAIMEHHRTANPARNFASVSFGPGEATRGQANDLTTRPVIRGKTYYTHAYHKGYTFRVGDWVHLMNATDPAKPIVAQIFKIAKRDEEKNEVPVLSCCWYYRPEQTVHTASRRFVAEEVFKTGLFADHPVDDVIEKIQVLFYTKWTRGRPGKHDWDPRSPLYFVEARYNERTYDFNKIKNWNSCLPEELRGSEPPIIPFPEPHPQPHRIESPFLRGVKGPGRLCEEEEVGRGQGESPSRASQEAADGYGDRPKKRPRMSERQGSSSQGAKGFSPMPHGGHQSYPPAYPPRPGGPPPPSGQRQGPLAHLPMGAPGLARLTSQSVANAQSILHQMSASMPDKIGRGEFNRLQQLFAGSNARGLDLQALSSGLANRVDTTALSRWRDAMQVFVEDFSVRGPAASASASSSAPSGGPGVPVSSGSTGGGPAPASASSALHAVPSRPAVIERSLASALAGVEAWVMPLPEATVELFTGGAKSEADRPEADGTTTTAAAAAALATDTTDEKDKSVVEEAIKAAEVKWFPGPPVYCHSAGTKVLPAPSLAYVAHRMLQSSDRQKEEAAPVEQLPSSSVPLLFEEYGLQAVWSQISEGEDEKADFTTEAQDDSVWETAETRALAQALLLSPSE